MAAEDFKSIDFLEHQLWLRSSDGRRAALALEPQSVASFYKRLMEQMHKLDLDLRINRRPNELPEAIPFDEDHKPRPYDAEYANRFWQVLEQADRVFKVFRARFLGKCSPVHFFWGAADLAVTRFSGRKAPQHPGGVPNLPDWVAREAYSHEVSSCGFWPGSGPIQYPAFYSYAYPEPAGFSRASVKPESASYSDDLNEFIVPYDEIRMLNHRMILFSISCRPPMKRRPIWRTGIAVRWNVGTIRRAPFKRLVSADKVGVENLRSGS